jgi:ABC-2 type transport system ATP-binding protein
MSLIEVDRLGRSFVVRRRAGRFRREAHTVHAVRDLSFAVEPGEMVGYIGPNGAGKSTTIKMLTGILVPTAGRLRVAGIDPSRDRVALTRRIGVVFGQRTTLWWDLPLRDSFALLRRIYRVDAARFRRNVDTFTELLDLGDLLDTPVRQLSLGQRMRGDIAAALLHDPEILYLDEPTIGLDVVSKGRLREFLRTLNAERGVTLLLTTHDLQDIEQLCSRVMVIDHGSLVYDGALHQLHARSESTRTLVVDLVDEADPIDVPGATVRRVEGPRQWLSFPADRSAAPLVAAVAAAYDVADLSIAEPDIEDVITRIYAHGVPGGPQAGVSHDAGATPGVPR